MIAEKASPWQPLRALILAPLETTRVATKLGAPKTPRLGLAQPPASTSEKIPLETKTNTGLQPGGGLVFIPSGSTGAQGGKRQLSSHLDGDGERREASAVQGRAVERCGVERTLKPIWFHPLPPDRDAPSLVLVSISSRVFTPLPRVLLALSWGSLSLDLVFQPLFLPIFQPIFQPVHSHEI